MQLEDKHFVYPDPSVMSGQDVVDRIQACLKAATANQDMWSDERLDWHNYIYRICLEYGIHPIWPLISLQRERSLLGTPGKIRDYDYATGFVGQDTPGTADPKKNGLPTQIFHCVRAAAWSANIGPRANFGYRLGIWPTAATRWRDDAQNSINLLDKNHNAAGTRVALNRAEKIQLDFTPHLEVMDENYEIFKGHIAPFF